MKNPLKYFIEWLSQNRKNTETNLFAQLILAYSPGLQYQHEGEEFDYISDLIHQLKKETLPNKIYGLSLFVLTYTESYFLDCENAERVGRNKGGVFNKNLLELSKNWETVKNFNIRYFDDYLFWIMEETFYGDVNTRIETLW